MMERIFRANAIVARFAPRNDRGEVYRHAASRWFHYEISGFFRVQKNFEIFSLRGLKNEPSRWLPIEGQNKFPRDP